MSLRGVVVVNTRPLLQQRELNTLLLAEGATVLSAPVFAIQPKAGGSEQADLRRYGVFVFVSVNAVRHFFGQYCLPDETLAVAIGLKTFAALKEQGVKRVIHPLSEQSNSESVWSDQRFQSAAPSGVVLVNGGSGRGYLNQRLQQQGIAYMELSVYERSPIALSDTVLTALRRDEANVLLFTSEQAFDAFIARCSELNMMIEQLRVLPLVTISERLAEKALRRGFVSVYASRKPSSTAMLACLKSIFTA